MTAYVLHLANSCTTQHPSRKRPRLRNNIPGISCLFASPSTPTPAQPTMHPRDHDCSNMDSVLPYQIRDMLASTRPPRCHLCMSSLNDESFKPTSWNLPCHSCKHKTTPKALSARGAVIYYRPKTALIVKPLILENRPQWLQK